MKLYNEAINIMLQTIGEQTLDADMDITDIYEAEQAVLIINNVKKEVLAEGWTFNTDYDWKFNIDTGGIIALPTNVLRIDGNTLDVIRKDGKLYDRANKTFKFTTGVLCEVSWDLDFDDLPNVAQNYILNKAARVMYQRLVGDTTMINVLLNDERQSYINLRNYEDDIGDYNIFNDTTVARAITRTSNPTGIRG